MQATILIYGLRCCSDAFSAFEQDDILDSESLINK